MDLDYNCDTTQVTNLTREDAAGGFLYTDVVAVIIVVVMPCILVFGVFSNLSFLVVVNRVKHMRTVTNYLLVQLALTDIVYLVFSIGERVWRYASSPVIFDKASEGFIVGCILIPFLKSTSYFASLFFLTFVTLEMYLAICRPIKHCVITSRALILRLTLASWGISISIACMLIPCNLVLKQVCIVWPRSELYKDTPTLVGKCDAVAPWLDKAHDIVQSSPFYIGMIVNAILYKRIMKTLRMRVAAPVQPFQLPVRARKQVAHMLVINYLVSFALLSPFECFSVVEAFSTDHATTNLEIVYMCRTLSYLNSAVNPLIFYTVHPRYRKAFVETCSWCIGKCRSNASGQLLNCVKTRK